MKVAVEPTHSTVSEAVIAPMVSVMSADGIGEGELFVGEVKAVADGSLLANCANSVRLRVGGM